MSSESTSSAAVTVETSEPPPRQRMILSVGLGQRTLWLAAALAVAVLLLVVLVTQALHPMILLLLAIVFGEGIRPLVGRLGRYHIPLPLAIILIYLALAVIAGTLLWLVFSPLVSQLTALIQHLPQYLKELQAHARDLEQQMKDQGSVGQAIQNLTTSLSAAAQQSIPGLLTVPLNVLSGVFSLFVDLVIILTMTMFWLLGSRTLKAFVVGLVPARSQAQASSIIAEVGLAFGGYVRGTVISMFIIGSVTGLGLALLGVPYALLLGVLAGLCELLPYLGPWLAGPISFVVALIASGPPAAAGVAVLFILIQELEGNVVEPLVMSRSVHIDPLVVIVVVLVGINLLGIIGAVLAVPFAAGVQVLVVRLLAPTIRNMSEGVARRRTPPVAAARGSG